jgi:hypothetical protein
VSTPRAWLPWPQQQLSPFPWPALSPSAQPTSSSATLRPLCLPVRPRAT